MNIVDLALKVLNEDLPSKYGKGLAKSTNAKRSSQFKKQAEMDDDNPDAYKPAPGDTRAKTKPSKHTKKFKQMYGEDSLGEKIANNNSKEKENV